MSMVIKLMINSEFDERGCGGRDRETSEISFGNGYVHLYKWL